ncbi:MAG: tetratricopeptide repeat protein, partial [Treponema sp.]|nr:tetratricopeptide repeat protein [Treponema sp.]
MSPIDIQDILERARNSARGGDHEGAERLLKSYLAKVPDSREARLLLGTTFARQGKLSDAADEFIALLADDPQDIEALNNAAVICRRQGKNQEALDYLKEAIDIEPTRAEFFYNIGNIHKQLDNFKAASMAYARVIELNPNYVPAYNNLGTIYEQLREYEKAYGVYRKGLTLDNNNPTLHFNYGVALEANGRLEDAADEYRAAMRSKPGWVAPMNNLGIVHFKQGRHDKALSTFNSVLNADPFNAETRNNIGVVLADQGRTKEAIKNYRQAIEADPKYAKAVVNLERALEASGNYADAVIELEKLVKLSPDNAEVRNRLAGLYLKMQRYPEALVQADAALEWDPESIQALRIQGASQRVMGNDAAAQASFEKILSLDPGNYSFLLDLADIHFHRKEYKEAEERLRSYLIRKPNDRNAKLLLGKLYAEMGNRAHAIQIFEELAKADPNDTEALTASAELLKQTGSLEKALRTADTLVNLQGKRATANDLSELNKSLEFYEHAVNAYSSSVREMWDRNMKLMAGEEGTSEDDDISRFMGAAVAAPEVEEDMEALFTEGPETFANEEENELLLGDDTFGELPEEAEEPLYRDPLDALAEGGDSPSSGPGRK